MIEMLVLRCRGAKRLEGRHHSIRNCNMESWDAGQELEVLEEGMDSHVGSNPAR